MGQGRLVLGWGWEAGVCEEGEAGYDGCFVRGKGAVGGYDLAVWWVMRDGCGDLANKVVIC